MHILTNTGFSCSESQGFLCIFLYEILDTCFATAKANSELYHLTLSQWKNANDRIQKIHKGTIEIKFEFQIQIIELLVT